MSRNNVELVRSICAAWERGDYGSAEWAHAEIEFVLADGPDPGTWTGAQGMADGWRGRLRAWEEFRQQAVEYRELDDEHVLVRFRVSGRARTSGLDIAEMQERSAGLFEVQHGKVTRFVAYFDGDRAVAELGFTEGDPLQ